jgi:competence protein ComEA
MERYHMRVSRLVVVFLFIIHLFPVYALTAQHEKINLNTANIEKLTHSFKGIGKKRAEAIIRYREQHGDFKSISELSQIQGISVAFIEKYFTDLQSVFCVE